MIKTILKSYEIEEFQALNSDGTGYVLNCEVIWLWGLFVTKKVKHFDIPHHHNTQKYFDHWDQLIKNKKNIYFPV